MGNQNQTQDLNLWKMQYWGEKKETTKGNNLMTLCRPSKPSPSNICLSIKSKESSFILLSSTFYRTVEHTEKAISYNSWTAVY